MSSSIGTPPASVQSAMAHFRPMNRAEAQQHEASRAQRAGHAATAAMGRPLAKVLDGRYDAFDNVMVLTVESYEYDASGNVIKTSQEDVYYEVTSLQVDRGDATSRTRTQLIGARTDAAMQKVLGPMIESFKSLTDASHLVDNALKKEQERMEEQGIRSSVVSAQKLVAFNLEAPPQTSAPGAPAPAPQTNMIVADQFLSETGETLPFLPAWCHSTSAGQLQVSNPSVLQKVLEASQWEDLIQPVDAELAKGPAAARRQHAYTFISPTRTLRGVKLAQTTENLLFSAFEDPSNPALGSKTLISHLKGQLATLESQKKGLEKKREALLGPYEQFEARLESNAPTDPRTLQFYQQSYNALGRLIRSLNSKIDQLDEAKEKRLDLIIFNAERQLSSQIFAVGTSPLGRNLSQEWHDLLYRSGLLDLDIPETVSPQSQEVYFNQVMQKLGTPFDDVEFGDVLRTIDSQVTRFQRAAQRPPIPPRPPGGHSVPRPREGVSRASTPAGEGFDSRASTPAGEVFNSVASTPVGEDFSRASTPAGRTTPPNFAPGYSGAQGDLAEDVESPVPHRGAPSLPERETAPYPPRVDTQSLRQPIPLRGDGGAGQVLGEEEDSQIDSTHVTPGVSRASTPGASVGSQESAFGSYDGADSSDEDEELLEAARYSPSLNSGEERGGRVSTPEQETPPAKRPLRMQPPERRAPLRPAPQPRLAQPAQANPQEGVARPQVRGVPPQARRSVQAAPQTLQQQTPRVAQPPRQNPQRLGAPQEQQRASATRPQTLASAPRSRRPIPHPRPGGAPLGATRPQIRGADFASPSRRRAQTAGYPQATVTSAAQAVADAAKRFDPLAIFDKG